MYKFLVVGCGGSGGETLARMMDQLRSELMPHGISKLPEGWQFVHVDVPTVPDTDVKGVGNVRDHGGTYIGTAPSSGSYSVLDSAVSQKLQQSGDLDQFVTWAPRKPAAVTTPLKNGAGQMRGVGRVITLNRAPDVFQGLQRAVNRMKTTEANSEMAEAARAIPGSGGFDPEGSPMVLVVSSMAGGAGASMALDVCRLLGQVQGVSVNDTCVYMYTSDIFPDRLEGVRPNALGMLGEIVSAQSVSSEEHDVRILEALGQHIDRSGGPSFARVFPVGKYQGLDRTTFGDGTQQGVYRGLARGLAALMVSGSASSSFRQYDLTNKDGLSPNRSYLGWGVEAGERLSWGTFGFGSLNLGRDRYRHYASQRLARTSVDRLREGHLQEGSSAGAQQQLNRLIDSQWDTFLNRVGLPNEMQVRDINQLATWIRGAAGGQQLDSALRQFVEQQAGSQMPRAQGQSGPNWLASLETYLRSAHSHFRQFASQTVVRTTFDWMLNFQGAFLASLEDAISDYGLPYARGLMEKMKSFLQHELTAACSNLGANQAPDIMRPSQQVAASVSAVRGNMVQGDQFERQVINDLHVGLLNGCFIEASQIFASVLSEAPRDFIQPLLKTIDESIQALDLVVSETSRTVGLANVETDVYSAWPSDQDQRVPERFSTAHNEVLITAAEDFQNLYNSHLPATIEGDNGWDAARQKGAAHVISGQWPAAEGSRAPGGLLEVNSDWRPTFYKFDPRSQESRTITPTSGRYTLHVKANELRHRALQFVNRRNEAFEHYCALSLEDYILGNDGAAPHEIDQRKKDVADKFRKTLTRALPLASVHPDVVASVHSSAVRYQYKFSSVPFGAAPDLVDALTEVLTSQQSVDTQTVDIFEKVVSQGQTAAGITHVDIFGSFGNLSPIAFDGVLQPVSDRWSRLTSAGQRRDFWTFRRARPLPASLPMSDLERRAMIAGWYVAQLTGQLQIPDRRNLGRPVRVFRAENQQWIDFPNPLLTPPSEFVGETFDWLPAVLESFLLAIANAHQTPVLGSLIPYQTLRSIYDGSEEEPASGLQIVAARDFLTDWLSTGKTPSGEPSRADAEDLEGRYTNARQFLETVHMFAASKLDTSANKSTASVRVDSRAQGSATPIFCDLVPDIVQVTEELMTLLDEAKTDAESNGGGGGFANDLPEGFGAF